MRVFVDTNVALDVFGQRQPFYRESARVWTLAEKGAIEGFVSAVSFTNLYYIIRKLDGRATARRAVRLLAGAFRVVACDARVIGQAIGADRWDFEDAVQYFSALSADAACIVTRDNDRFPESDLPILTPAAFLAAHSFA